MTAIGDFTWGGTVTKYQCKVCGKFVAKDTNYCGNTDHAEMLKTLNRPLPQVKPSRGWFRWRRLAK